jgi:uncharacterized protein YbcC (UPF0753/DUF2309 family)
MTAALALATIIVVVWTSSRVEVNATVEQTMFPKFGYYLDESDADLAMLRRKDGYFVAAFSARGFTNQGVVEAAKEDYRALLEGEDARSGG